MITLSLKQAYDRAGVYDTDSDMERDLKFAAWIQNQTYLVVSQDQAADINNHEIDILIIR